MTENYELVQKAFRILHPLLASYIASELNREYPNAWWQEVLATLSDQSKDLPSDGNFDDLVKSLDVANCLRLFDRKWNDVFRKKLSIDYRTWAKELMGIRNKLAHLSGNDFNENDTWRALDTVSRLCDPFDAKATEEIRDLLRTARYGSAEGSIQATVAPPVSEPNRKPEGTSKSSFQGLPSWRDVMEPHPDVAQGLYKKAEFAADLAQVSRGEGAYEYRDPVEFFNRTYVTEGMTGLLVQALRRISGKDGEPVIQLKTAFGGGKTHSMLALYHMMRGRTSIDRIPNVKPVLERAEVSSLPKANVAVLVGTALDPARSKRPQNMPGITINTLWGEMAAQLAESAGNPKIYDYVKEADKKGVSPGSEALKNLFDAAAPCLILMDELVAYAKKLYGVTGLPAGTFDNFISFIQEITEAARASKNSLVVASIPESDIEIGGEAGKTALETIEHTFGRMESIWKPVTANEGFEVVRRRLFLDCRNPDERDAVCTKFSQMYNENPSDFPLEAREVEYRNRMVSCYPIHPEVFDRLYEDWATLERFQRTRGVLRLMAAVIHELWMDNDANPMIMPGSIPLNVPNVRDELTRHLPEGWNAIVDREVDGKKSVPYQKDQSNARYGTKLAARRVARTIMLGSAPTSRSQNIRGIEASRIRLGVVQPSENIANFNDALSTLKSSLAYLYTDSSDNRFWYDTRPTLRKTVEDRATQIPTSDVEYEIERRLRTHRKEKPLAGLHVCPSSSLDVPDERAVRIVVLRPTDAYKVSNPQNAAVTSALEILNNRGSTPRIYRNMLAFVAPDQDLMASLRQAVKLYLAWKSIKDDSEALNLDAAQNREADNHLKRSHETVDVRIQEAYCWLLVPSIDKDGDMKNIVWNPTRISGGDNGIVSKAVKKMLQEETMITRWAPALLLMELDNLLWKETDHIAVKTLWDHLCTYCYLPRLTDETVLHKAIQAGVNSDQYFAFASGWDDTRYLGLKFNQLIDTVEHSGYLVKISVARKQIADEEAKRQAESSRNSGDITIINGGDGNGGGTGPQPGDGTSPPKFTDPIQPPLPPPPPKNRRFFMAADLDITRINRDVQRYVEEIIQHLTSVDNAKVRISLEVDAENIEGFNQQTVRTISENCRTLRVRESGFSE